MTGPFSHHYRRSKPRLLPLRSATAFVPANYEPHYAYPLLVLFHGRGGDEQQLLRLMPKVSSRNYVAVGLRGTQTLRPRRDGSVGYGWAQAAPHAGDGEGAATLNRPRMPSLTDATSDALCDHVMQAVRETRGELNVHTNRIYLVGYGEGAAAAYRLGLGMPHKFAGIVAINGWLPRPHGPLMWLPQARRLRVLIVHGHDNELVPIAAAESAHRQLLTAGIDTTLETVDAGHRIHSHLLHTVDEWVMDFTRPDAKTAKVC